MSWDHLAGATGASERFFDPGSTAATGSKPLQMGKKKDCKAGKNVVKYCHNGEGVALSVIYPHFNPSYGTPLYAWEGSKKGEIRFVQRCGSVETCRKVREIQLLPGETGTRRRNRYGQARWQPYNSRTSRRSTRTSVASRRRARRRTTSRRRRR